MLLLSRIQFGFVMSFHIIFPAFTIGLASWLAFLAGMYLKTRRRLARAVFVLAEDLCRVVRAGRRVRHRHELSVRHELVRALDSRRQCARAPALLRSSDRVLPRSHFPRRHAVRLATRVAAAALLRHLHGGARHADLDVLDHLREQLDAHAGGLRASSTACSMRRLVEDRFNPSFPFRLAHMVLAAFITTCFVIGGVSAMYLLRQRHREAAQLMLKLSSLRRDHRAAADLRRRPAWTERARTSAREARGHRRPLGNPARRAVDSVRVAGPGSTRRIATKSACRSSAA